MIDYSDFKTRTSSRHLAFVTATGEEAHARARLDILPSSLSWDDWVAHMSNEFLSFEENRLFHAAVS